MLIGFIGCPCSGKTTTAAMTFADLKQMGLTAEYIPEYARIYIAQQKKIKESDTVSLTDWDQLQIIFQQESMEELIVDHVPPETVVISDSSIFNTLLYFQEEDWKAKTASLVARGLKRYNLLFYCAPFEFKGGDPLRIHNQDQSLEIDRKIPEMLRELKLKPILLFGDPKERHHLVIKTILEESLR